MILIGLAGCATESHPTTAAPHPGSSAVTAPTSGDSAVASDGSCHSRGGLPDPVCTPGESDGRVSQDSIRSICVPGWSASARPPVGVTEPIKRERVQAYGVDAPLSTVELDHLEPVSLGGASTVANLWPEPWDGPEGAGTFVVVCGLLYAVAYSVGYTYRRCPQEGFSSTFRGRCSTTTPPPRVPRPCCRPGKDNHLRWGNRAKQPGVSAGERSSSTVSTRPAGPVSITRNRTGVRMR